MRDGIALALEDVSILKAQSLDRFCRRMAHSPETRQLARPAWLPPSAPTGHGWSAQRGTAPWAPCSGQQSCPAAASVPHRPQLAERSPAHRAAQPQPLAAPVQALARSELRPGCAMRSLLRSVPSEHLLQQILYDDLGTYAIGHCPKRPVRFDCVNPAGLLGPPAIVHLHMETVRNVGLLPI